MQKIIQTGTTWDFKWFFSHASNYHNNCLKVEANGITVTYENGSEGWIPKKEIDNWDELQDTIELSIDNMLVS